MPDRTQAEPIGEMVGTVAVVTTCQSQANAANKLVTDASCQTERDASRRQFNGSDNGQLGIKRTGGS